MVQQQSISVDACRFWRAVGNQIQNSGGVFDTLPATIQGNLANINDPKEQVWAFLELRSGGFKEL